MRDLPSFMNCREKDWVRLDFEQDWSWAGTSAERVFVIRYFRDVDKVRRKVILT